MAERHWTSFRVQFGQAYGPLRWALVARSLQEIFWGLFMEPAVHYLPEEKVVDITVPTQEAAERVIAALQPFLTEHQGKVLEEAACC